MKTIPAVVALPILAMTLASMPVMAQDQDHPDNHTYKHTGIREDGSADAAFRSFARPGRYHRKASGQRVSARQADRILDKDKNQSHSRVRHRRLYPEQTTLDHFVGL